MGNPLVSVIIPAFNRAHCIGRAIQSVLAQQMDSFEILLGDDASMDGTVEEARRRFPEVRVARLATNTGAAAARNAAARLARGRFLAFLDSDDEWLPDKISMQLDVLNRNPEVGVCACGHELRRKDGSTVVCHGRNADFWPRALAFAQSFHGASTPVVRAEIWERVGEQDESLRVLEDWDWMLRASRQTGIHVLSSPLVRIHENAPSNPEFTLISTSRFLARHEREFAAFGKRVHAEIASQHWENAARNHLLHGMPGSAAGLMCRAFRIAPWRNPKLLPAAILAAVEAKTRTNFLRSLLLRYR